MSKQTTKPSYTKKITDNNVLSVRKQISLKQGCDPFFATINDAESVITDMDHFPYTRFFRGVYYSSDPVVLEREAGWRPQNNQCYKYGCAGEGPYPNHCFESACSVVYPCYPQYLRKYSDRQALDVQLNRACIVQYR